MKIISSVNLDVDHSPDVEAYKELSIDIRDLKTSLLFCSNIAQVGVNLGE